MTIDTEDQLEGLRRIGRIVAATLARMAAAAEPGMTTRELDAIGRAALEAEGARPAPELVYGFPGATCISIAPAVAHGVPDDRHLQAGDLVNVDVSAEKDGFFADTGGSFLVMPGNTPGRDAALAALLADGRAALDAGVGAVAAGRRFNGIGRAVETVARRRGRTLLRNLQGHGTGSALHEAPAHIPAHWVSTDRRTMRDGQVFTIEPFLSDGARWAHEGGDGWTLVTDPRFATVQFEHTVVATRRGAIVLTEAPAA